MTDAISGAQTHYTEVPPSSNPNAPRVLQAMTNHLLESVSDILQHVESGPSAASLPSNVKTQVSQLIAQINQTIAQNHNSLQTASGLQAERTQLGQELKNLKEQLPPGQLNVFKALESMVIGKAMGGVFSQMAGMQKLLSLQNKMLQKYFHEMLVELPNGPTQINFPGRVSQMGNNLLQWLSAIQGIQQLHVDVGNPLANEANIPINVHVEMFDSFVGKKIPISQMAAANKAHFASLVKQLGATHMGDLLAGIGPAPAHPATNAASVSPGPAVKLVANDLIQHAQTKLDEFKAVPEAEWPTHLQTPNGAPGRWTSVDLGRFVTREYFPGRGGWVKVNKTQLKQIKNILSQRLQNVAAYHAAQGKVHVLLQQLSVAKQEGLGQVHFTPNLQQKAWLTKESGFLKAAYAKAKAADDPQLQTMIHRLQVNLGHVRQQMARLGQVNIQEQIVNKTHGDNPFGLQAKIFYRGQEINNEQFRSMVNAFNNVLNGFDANLKSVAGTIGFMSQTASAQMQGMTTLLSNIYSVSASLLSALHTLIKTATHNIKAT